MRARGFRRPCLPLLAIVFLYLAASGSAAAASRVFEKSGLTVEALVDGQGPLVVMIASLGRPAEDFDDLARRLAAAGFTAVRLQPRGVGKSRGPMQGQTLMDLAGDAALAIETLGGAPVVVLGHAYGQRVARALAASRPELVRAVVTLAAGGKVPIPDKASAALRGCFDATLSPEQHLENVRIAHFAPGHDPSPWRDGWHAETAQLQSAATKATPLANWWGAGRAPLLVVQGLQDAIALPENGRALKAELGERVTLVEIDGAGHALLPEQPDATAKAVLDYLSKL